MKKTITNKLALPVAVITCPCHLFILVLLLAGTTAGAFLSKYFIPLVIVFSILFVISLTKALKHH